MMSYAIVCTDTKEECIEPASTRTVKGMEIHRNCWKYKYVKTCKTSSANDCHKINPNQCNFTERDCLEKATVGGREFCINDQKEYLCSWDEEFEIRTPELVMDPDNKQASMSLLCKAFCIDGDCPEAHKADYKDNKEIAEALAQLQMLKDARAGLVDKDSLHFNIFSGSSRHCNTKKTGYTKCCSDSGWAKSLGASCKPEEAKLIEEANKGRCVYVGESKSKDKFVRKKFYCCYPNVLSRVIQEGARKQLGRDFGSAPHPQCQGFTIEEIEKIDFSKINMDEFFAREVMPNMKEYDAKDNQDIMNRAFPNVKDKEEGKNEDLLRTSE